MRNYIINNSYKASKGIATAVLVSLGIGLLLQTVGQLINFDLLVKIGGVSKTLFLPAIGACIAISLNANSSVIVCSMISAAIGGGGIVNLSTGGIGIVIGEPIGAIIAALFSIWIGKRISGKTNFDMLLTPLACLIVGGLIGLLSSKIISPILLILSNTITMMLEVSPILSSITIAVIFALLILSPASSAALAIALQLDSTASAAALIGCSVQFTAFAFLSIKENTIGAFFGQLICTPKLQTPNIIKSPKIMILPLILSGLMSPIGVVLFGIKSTNEVAGLGLCAFVAPLNMMLQGGSKMLIQLLMVTVLIPALICLVVRPMIFKFKWIDSSDLKINLD